MSTPFFSMLCLESNFPRPIGDSANPQTHSFPVRVAVVENANVDRVVYEGSRGLITNFVQKANEHIKLGAIAVGTSCGFLLEHQLAIQNQINVPFVSSALTMLSTALKEPIAILSFDADVLNAADWFKKACLQNEDVVVGDIPRTGHLYTVIKTDQRELDIQVAQEEVLQSALNLVQASTEKFGLPPRTLLFECTNLGVYKIALQKALQLRQLECKLIDYNDTMTRCWNSLKKQTI